MSIDSKFIEVTADVFSRCFSRYSLFFIISTIISRFFFVQHFMSTHRVYVIWSCTRQNMKRRMCVRRGGGLQREW